MFKKVFSLLLCIVMCVTCFSTTAIEVGAVYEAKTLFAITSTPVKDGVLNYTINITANQMDIAGAIIYVAYDSTVLRPANSSPAQTTNATSGEVQNFEGTFIHGVTENDPNVYSIAYMNEVAQSTEKTAKPFFNIRRSVFGH